MGLTVVSRDVLGDALNSCGLTGLGVEVGTLMGEYSDKLLRTWRGRCLFSVDRWESRGVSGMGYTDIDEHHLARYFMTLSKLRLHGSRSVVVRMDSVNASKCFNDGALDFVYIDADHNYDSVVSDIECWASKVKQGGWLCGHDWFDGAVDGCGVTKAVKEYAEANDKEVNLTQEEKLPYSWIIEV